jgi:HSP20 family molecular chaperone IbpA
MTQNFDELFSAFSDEVYKSDTGYPRYNIWNSEDSSFISIACTGIPEEQLNAYIDDEGLLVIEAVIEQDNREYIAKQYPIKSFQKRFVIGNKHEIGTITYENGELTVRLNQKEPTRKEIPIISAQSHIKAA